MTNQRDIDTLLDSWLDDGPTQSSDRVMDAVVERIARQGQRPRWRFYSWRAIPVIVSRPLLAATAAVLIVGLAAFTVLRPGGSGSGGRNPSLAPSPSSSVAASASPSEVPSSSPIACEDNLPGCAGPLAAGDHSSTNFQPALTYRTTVGWSNVIDTPAIFKLDSTGGQPYILAWADAKIANQTATCDPLAKAGAAQTATAWIDYATTHPGLKASAPVTVDFGGITGTSIDLEILPSWKTTCPNHGASPYVMFSVAEGGDYGVTADQRLHVTVVDVGGKALVMEVYGPLDAAQFASTLASVTPVIQSIRFPGG